MEKEIHNIMVVGSGGREHALAWKLAQSNFVSKVFVAPGNAGTSLEEKCVNIPIDGAKKSNFEDLYKFVRDNRVNMVVVGPEQPLADGITDFFREKNYSRVFGPSMEASRLESSKIFSYKLMLNHGIPQAVSIICTGESDAKIVMEEMFAKYGGVALKADGFTGGKGVFVTGDRKEAEKMLPEHIHKYCPDGRLLVAQRLVGEEFSVFGFADGKKVVPILMSVQDHKPLNDNDKGPNTGGMGAYCPAPIAPASVVQEVCDRMMTPIAESLGFVGFLYLGGMMTKEGVKVIEYNIRFGDPECQPAMMMIKSDLFGLISDGLEGKLSADAIEFNPGAACCVVLAARGYPENVSAEKGKVISGIREANELGGVKVFHAGTKYEHFGVDQIGTTVINGGRVLGVTGYSPDGIAVAQRLAYEAVSKIKVSGGFHYRTEIANKAFNYNLIGLLRREHL